MSKPLAEVLGMFPGLAEAVADATREETILKGMSPEHREAMRPAVEEIVRGKTRNFDDKTHT